MIREEEIRCENKSKFFLLNFFLKRDRREEEELDEEKALHSLTYLYQPSILSFILLPIYNTTPLLTHHQHHQLQTLPFFLHFSQTSPCIINLTPRSYPYPCSLEFSSPPRASKIRNPQIIMLQLHHLVKVTTSFRARH